MLYVIVLKHSDAAGSGTILSFLAYFDGITLTFIILTSLAPDPLIMIPNTAQLALQLISSAVKSVDWADLPGSQQAKRGVSNSPYHPMGCSLTMRTSHGEAMPLTLEFTR